MKSNKNSDSPVGTTICFKTEKKLIEEAMRRLNVIVPTRDSDTLLSHVLLSVYSDNVSITASDMESTVRIFIQAQDTQEGEVIVKAKKLSDIATVFKSESFVFSAEEQKVHEQKAVDEETSETRYKITIKGKENGSAKYTMPGGFRSHFPEINTISEEKLFTLPAPLLLEMINKTFYAISQEENRYIYSGLCLKTNGNKITLIGTDGRRLSAITRKLPQTIQLGGEDSEVTDDIVVYSKAIKELRNLLSNIEGNIQIGVEQKDIFFRVDNAELSSRLLEGKFPDYEKVIPKGKKISLKLERRLLLDTFEEVMVMTEEPARQVRMQLQKESLLFEANAVDVGASEKSLPIEWEGKDISICFNGSYIQDILRNISSPQVLFSMEDENKPIMIHDPEDVDFISLVMPMHT